MRVLLKFPVIFLLFALIMLISGCTSSSSVTPASPASNASTTTATTPTTTNNTSGKITIGVSIPNMNDRFISYVASGMQAYAKTQPDVTVIYADAKNDPSTQLQQIKEFIAQDVKAITFLPMDPTISKTIVDLANQANIPIIAVNRTFKELTTITSYIGSDSLTAGTLQMNEVARLLGGKGNIAIMDGDMGSDAQVNRTKGNKEVIAKYPNMKIIFEETANYDRAKGMALMAKWLASKQHIDAVVANNDEMIIGAMLAAQVNGQDQNIIFAGVDGTMDALNFMKADKLKVTVFQNAAAQGSKGLQTTIEAANGKKVAKEIIIPYELITQANEEKYIAKWK
ncbi:sugar ABC transporter substrate-binding protein [Paenibacillus nicotianae]|uniref:Sugar ABC transporter substrate-binding protein n=1 Tax=Paenibacillus nicotianae TaxID=1526551 RepID=A0ABW4UUB0_9BACL